MNNRRAKLAAAVTVLGLGALGGVALGTNSGVPAAVRHVSGNPARIVTSTSGASTAATQPAALRTATRRHTAIVTRASGLPGIDD
jgi:hypothetical protein